MRKVVYFRPAQNDIESISDFISQRNAAAATSLTRAIDDAVELLAAAPSIGHRRTEFKNPSLRCHGVGNYCIIYRYDDANLYVLRVVHGHRDFKKLFRP